MNKPVAIFGSVWRTSGQAVGIELKIPSTKPLAARTFLGHAILRFLLGTIQESVGIGVIHVDGRGISHVAIVAVGWDLSTLSETDDEDKDEE